jgi:glucosamine--fructose-6-phosphate aminotransferase (isomerizing)
MCGIVGAVSTRNIVPILVQGLQRLEYRGYDSCGVAGQQPASSNAAKRRLAACAQHRARGRVGGAGRRRTTGCKAAPALPTPAGPPTAHQRCTTPTRTSATAQGRTKQLWPCGLVHNGIIENHDELRAALQAKGYVFCQPNRHRGDGPPGRQRSTNGDIVASGRASH